MIDYCILGSGISGSTIANLLSKKHSVVVVDKSKGIGGRTSNKRLKTFSFDHGLQYYSSKNKQFEKFLNLLMKKKVLKYWNGNHLDFTFKKKIVSRKIIGTNGNNNLCKFLLNNINKILDTEILSIKYKEKKWIIKSKHKLILAKNVIITFPFQQTVSLAKKFLKKNILDLKVKMEPNLTLLVSENNAKRIPISSIKLSNSILSWISNENSKERFISKKNLWTIQTNYKFSNKNINFYKKKRAYYSKLILNEFVKITGIKKKKLKIIKIHGWKYSYNRNKTKFKSYWDNNIGFGLCGDWLIGPNAESAWLSASNLYSQIKKPA